MITRPSRSIVAEELAEVLHSVLHFPEDSSKKNSYDDPSSRATNEAVSVSQLTDKLMRSDFVEVGALNLPDVHVTGGGKGRDGYIIKRTASNVCVYWKWTLDAEEESQPTKCTSLVLSMGDINLHLSKVYAATKEDNEIDSRHSGIRHDEEISDISDERNKADATNSIPPEEIEKNTAYYKEHNYNFSENFSAFEFMDSDSILGKWLSEVSSSAEIRVARLRVTADPEIPSSGAIHNLIFPTMNTGIFGLLLTNFEPLVVVTSISLYLPSHNNVGLNIRLNGCSCRTSVWYFEDVQVVGVVLGYDVTVEASTVMLSFKSSSFTGSVKEVTNLEVKEQGYYLKIPLQAVSLLFDGNCFDIKCTSVLSLGQRILTECQVLQKKTLLRLHFHVRLSFSNVTLKMDAQSNPEHILTAGNLIIDLEPVFETQEYFIRISLRLSSICYCGWLQAEKISLTGTMNMSCTTIHYLVSSVSSARFDMDKSSIDWLENINDMVQLDRTRGIVSPNSDVQSFNLKVSSQQQSVFAKNYVIRFEEFHGGTDTTLNSMARNYTDKLHLYIKKMQKSNRDYRSDMADQVAIAAGSAILGASILTPVGAAVSVASLGVRDGVGTAVRLGKESRGAGEDDRYVFGDAARGMATMARGAVSRLSSRNKGRTDSGAIDGAHIPREREKEFILKDKVRLAAVGGMSVGGAVGMGVCAAAGPAVMSPVMVVSAASYVGYNAAKSAMQKKQNKPK